MDRATRQSWHSFPPPREQPHVPGAAAYRAQLRDWPDRRMVGGQAYDAVIMACAVKARADVGLTLNPRHFLALGEYAVEILVPL